MLVLFLLLAVLEHTNSQCVPIQQCGCNPSSAGVSCCLEVQENLAANTRVGEIDSIDVPMPNPQYGLVDPPNINGTFRIDQSGVIFTQRMLDREQEGNEFPMFVDNGYCFELAVSVSVNSLVLVKVSDVNDNPPMFSKASYTIEVPETTTTQSDFECTPEIINLLEADDLDEEVNAMVRYSVEGNPDFIIDDPSMPCGVNAPNFVLDRDFPPTNYSFTLVATNVAPPNFSSRTTVTYVLQDRNDNQPIFENETYSISIREDVQQMSPVFQFRARDIDLGSNGGDSLVYDIRNGNGVGIFEINETSGVLTLIGKVDADGQVKSYMLEVVARDGGTPPQTGTAIVVVSIIDVNEPVTLNFQNQVHEITEDRMSGTLAFFTIVDRDSEPNNNNSVEVFGGDGAFNASFVPVAGGYTLQQVRSVDFEQNRTIQIIIRTTERGDPPITQDFPYNLTVLDVNDNRPGLMPTQFNIVEEMQGNQLIADLSQHVFDLDSGVNGMVGEYRLVSVRSSSADLTSEFRGTLDSNTGMLTTGSVRIDREVFGNSLDYMVTLTDMGEPPLSQTVSFMVTIRDINDNSPVFQMPRYAFSLEENLQRGGLGTVQATDIDYLDNGIIVYSIIEEGSQFSVNERTGQVTGEISFDRETRGSYHVNISAHDRGTPQRTAETVAMVMIRITDVEDEDPMFVVRHPNFTIDTSLSPGGEIGRVLAVDEDLSPFNQTVYKLESNSSIFSINQFGVITLQSSLTGMDEFQLNISAFNPGREARKDTITALVSVIEAAPLQLTLIAGVAGGVSVLLILIVIVLVIMVCTYCRNRRFSSQYNMKEISNNLNNLQHPILKMPVTPNNQQGRSRVTFKESVEETHYIQQSVVLDTDNTVRKESITKFDNSPRIHHQFSASDEEEMPPNHSSSKDLPTVIELEVSPTGHMVNGSLPPSHHVHGSYDRGPHSPIVHVVNRGDEVDFSQNTSSDGHTYMDDEESMFSDDASIVNASIVNTRYSNNHDLNPQYRTPPSHSHLDLHRHLPPMTHGQPTSSSLAQLHAHNLAQLAEANRQQQYAGSLHNTASEHEHSLTLTPRNPLQHDASISTQSTHSPHSLQDHTHSHMATSASSSSNHIHSGGRNYPHPLIMPDAFPRDTTDIHIFPMGSYADYGEASTYASADLDEALGFNLEAEPGIISLTATDYEDTEL